MYRELMTGAALDPALFATVLFVALFIGIVAWAFWPRAEHRFDRAAALPLEDGEDGHDRAR